MSGTPDAMLDDLSRNVYRFPSRVSGLVLARADGDPASVVPGIPKALADRARERVPDPSMLADHEMFAWQAHISNNQLDSYSTRMMPSSLKNYAADAEAGVPFMDSHNIFTQPIGRSLTGKYHGPQGDGIAWTESSFFTLAGVNDRADEFIMNARSGLTTDVSIGFNGGRMICSICKRDMYRDWSCPHFPGFEYIVTEDGRQTDAKILCEGHVEDARLIETSGVYSGATPSAAILKVYRFMDDGRASSRQVEMLGARYRHRFPERPVLVPGARIPTVEVTDVTGTNGRVDPPADDAQRTQHAETLRAVLAALGNPADADPVRAIAALNERVQSLTGEVERLTPLAQQGESYRTELIEDAMTQGRRAHGETFVEAPYAEMFRTASVEHIRAVRDGWRNTADKVFAGGRRSAEEVESKDERTAPGRRRLPANAHRA